MPKLWPCSLWIFCENKSSRSIISLIGMICKRGLSTLGYSGFAPKSVIPNQFGPGWLERSWTTCNRAIISPSYKINTHKIWVGFWITQKANSKMIVIFFGKKSFVLEKPMVILSSSEKFKWYTSINSKKTSAIMSSFAFSKAVVPFKPEIKTPSQQFSLFC